MGKHNRTGILMRVRQARQSHARGQSLVEMLVALIVLAPMAVGITLLGQYIHLKQQAQSAARQAAWAATVAPEVAAEGIPDSAKMQQRLRARNFGLATGTLSSEADAPARFADTMLTTFAGNELLKPGGVTLSVYKQEAAPTYLGKALDVVAGATKSLGNLPPNSKGLVTAEVHVRPELVTGRGGQALDILDPLDTLQLDFTATSVLLADAWNAAGGGENKDGEGEPPSNPVLANRTVREVIRPLVPTSWLGDSADEVFSDVVNVLGKLPIVKTFFTAGMENFQLGRMAPDVVPTDKLAKYKDVH